MSVSSTTLVSENKHPPILLFATRTGTACGSTLHTLMKPTGITRHIWASGLSVVLALLLCTDVFTYTFRNIHVRLLPETALLESVNAAGHSSSKFASFFQLSDSVWKSSKWIEVGAHSWALTSTYYVCCLLFPFGTCNGTQGTSASRL